jgi:hypothetical protein
MTSNTGYGSYTMSWMNGRNESKPGTRARGRRVEVEALEGRELMAANFTVADTLFAKDNINLEAIFVRQTIEQLRIENLNSLSTVVTNAQNQTAAIASDFQGWKAQEAVDRAAGNRSAVAFDRQQEALDLRIGAQVRSWLRAATVSSHTTQTQLLKDEGNVGRGFQIATGYLARNFNPTLVQNQAVAGIDRLGAIAQQHANAGQGSLAALDSLINNSFNGGNYNNNLFG